MRHAKIFTVTALMMFALGTQAQFFQAEGQKQWMKKLEIGVLPYTGNVGNPGQYGYTLNDYQAAAGIDFMFGRNLSQDFMLGGGWGAYYVANIKTPANYLLAATLFVDLDYRPIWSNFGADNTPKTYRFAPMTGARAGVSLLLDDVDRYGLTLGPYGELYAGVNWYYRHGLRNMEHNWRSLYLQVGVAYMHQTIFLPVRLGWRL